ncbi:EamA family transporter [Oscillatoria sp. CS-180]|uniref:DMT family transporter n=1 Tax=Oscillatoria sp. CS-180 TaxID=3021720 RepID=UPI00232ABFCC|nr:EamA family transporter [Oscillatoria sp. CS-180]MDB9527197.1 EamA family transporter [Oscillatoria sp. CS-180]
MESRTNAPMGARSGLLMILMSAILWGTVGVFVQGLYSLSEANPLSVGLFRLAIASPVLLLVCTNHLGWQTFRIARRDLMLMLLTGAMTAFYQVCYFAAIGNIGVAAATLITLCTAPVWVAMLALILLRERLSLGILLAGLCAISGTILLINVDSGEITVQSKTAWGICLALSSAAGYASVTLCSRSLARRYHPLQSLTVSFLAGTIFLFPATLMTGLVFQYPLEGWMSLLYLGIVTTALAYLLYFSGIRHTSATVASIVTLVEPLTSTLLAWWVLGERLDTGGFVGGGLLILSIGLLYWEGLRQSRRTSEKS